MGEKIKKDVREWDLSSYPEKDPRDGMAGSRWWRFTVLESDGRTAHKRVVETVTNDKGEPMRDDDGKVMKREKIGGPRMWAVTGGIGAEGFKKGLQGHPASKIAVVDILRAEKEISGKPSIVQMGLFYEPVFDDEGRQVDWKEQDRKKEFVPKYWRDMTVQYYDEDRPKAYKNAVDPYAGQKKPTTRIQELTEENELMRKKLEAENEELRRRLEKKK